MYSQNNEEQFIVDYFKQSVGKFIEIGGYDPFRFSNVRRLYELGWSGVIVEPSPKCFNRLKAEYENESRITLCDYAIGKSNETLKFYDAEGDAIGTLDVSHMNKWNKNKNVTYNEIYVKCVAMSDFISEHGHDCSFLNIDVEGINYTLFQLLPDSILNSIKLICIEHDGKHQEIRNKLAKYGFKDIHLNPENLIMGK
jgi:FkbM family methyltransferase